jgi:RHS repeat-associated protein
MPGRSYVSSSSYRYGFNGKENDNEVKGTGNQQDYGMRIYDPRLGRFLSVDPISRSYPMLTPYQFASNTPIQAIDLDGLEACLAQINENARDTRKPMDKVADWILNTSTKEKFYDIVPADDLNTSMNYFTGDQNVSIKDGVISTVNVALTIEGAGKILGRLKPKNLLTPSTKSDVILETNKTQASTSLIRKNAEKGAKFEKKVLNDITETQTNLVEQITVKTQSGIKTRIDIVGRDKSTGQIKLTEAKSSQTAPLTKNQKIAFPELEKTGGTVVGEGKESFPGGSAIPPTKVDVVRPEQ